MDLVVLAGGMGARFGGSKQTAVVDDYGSYLLDYSLFNAIEVGFDHIIFITNEMCYDQIKQKYGVCLKGVAKCDVVVQDNNSIYQKMGIQRTKPLGTGYALLCLKNKIDSNFAIINADDYYGKNSFRVAMKFLKNLSPGHNEYALIGYEVKNTLSDNGKVKRGICATENNNLIALEESIVFKQDGKIYATDLNGNNGRYISDDNLVSMNMLCFDKQFLEYLQSEFEKFLSEPKNVQEKEFLIPEVLEQLVASKKTTVKVLPTTDVWIGMTYRQDFPMVVELLKNLVDEGQFPKDVCNNFKKVDLK